MTSPNSSALLQNGHNPGREALLFLMPPLPAGFILHFSWIFYQILSRFPHWFQWIFRMGHHSQLDNDILSREVYFQRKGLHQNENLFCGLIQYLRILSLQLRCLFIPVSKQCGLRDGWQISLPHNFGFWLSIPTSSEKMIGGPKKIIVYNSSCTLCI